MGLVAWALCLAVAYAVVWFAMVVGIVVMAVCSYLLGRA